MSDNENRQSYGAPRSEQPRIRFQGFEPLRGLRMEPSLPFTSMQGQRQMDHEKGYYNSHYASGFGGVHGLRRVLFGASPSAVASEPMTLPNRLGGPGGPGGPTAYDELLKVEKERKNFEKTTARTMKVSVSIMVVTMGIFITILLGTLYVLWQVGTNVSYYSKMVNPYVTTMTGDAAQMLHSGAAMAVASDELVQHSVPEMMASVNRTAAIVKQMFQLAQHPVVKIALSGVGGDDR